MKTRFSPGFALCFLLLVLAASEGDALSAQSPLSLEVRGGRAFPMEGFRLFPGAEDELAAGHAFGVNFQYLQGLGVSAVVGFSQYRVQCEGTTCGAGEEWVSTQWELGARWRPVDTGLAPWLSAAVLVPKVERGGPGNDRVSDTSFGLEAGAGLRIRLTPRWSLEPAARWASFDADFEEGAPVTITFLTAGMGLRVTF